ncbi:MAG: proteasome accessory factor PafA2 family protein [Chthonomonadales bacterium]
MNRLFGLETEYGIAVEGKGASDLIQESIKLVSCVGGDFVTGWNYGPEDSRRDLRGFTVDRLSTNPDDAQFDIPTDKKHRVADERNDHILGNGGRLYNDHGHPEYSTPECSSLLDLVAHDKAGERIVWECALARMDDIRTPISIYKNNTDYHGSSYGTHESYLMSRLVPPVELIQSLIPFLVTRQIFCGAGKVGVEVDNSEPIFQISARADFFSAEASVDTLHNRPIVNTRDEPHAAPTKYRRLHVIIGDANMSEWTTAMKVGTTSLVVQLLEDGWRPYFQLKNPIRDLKGISRDSSLTYSCVITDGHQLSAIDIQRRFLSEAQCRFEGKSEEIDWVLAEWHKVLRDLSDAIAAVSDRVDWAAKYQLLEEFRKQEDLTWGDPFMQSLDLSYHDVDPETGLYHGLVEANAIRRLVSDERIESAMTCAPSNTRAAIRGAFVKRFPSSIRSIGWNGIAFEYEGENRLFDMNTLVEDNLEDFNNELNVATSLHDVVDVITRKPNAGE